MENKVVVHTCDGRVLKGLTHDFDAARSRFHLLPAEGGGVPVAIQVDELKALFFVKDFLGNRAYDPPSGFGASKPRGRRCIVTFIDGEVIFGSTPDFGEQPLGFTLYPADPTDNNASIFVCQKSLKSVEFQEEENRA